MVYELSATFVDANITWKIRNIYMRKKMSGDAPILINIESIKETECTQMLIST